MKTESLRCLVTTVSLVGLLVLAGAFSNPAPASAQTPLDCPLPAGVTPPPPLPVTAEQVENGTASLRDFALTANQYSGLTDHKEAVYRTCLVRQEGSSWRSGSTYIVTLTLDGRVFVHARDMALSGRLLNPVIYQAILHALGIDPADLTDPAAAMGAFRAAMAGQGGPFDAPSVPGASGYATVYFSASLRQPLVQITGFDLDASHLVEEVIAHADPAIAASDVVDRTTLKDFVTAAGEYFIEFLETGDLAATSQARIAFRDPNGPWRHGPVYLSVMDRASRFILFHGAFPDRFELRQGGIARDIASGDLVVEQLIDAAEGDPEGGFWLYYFDNPADDTDSAEVPKVGYARVFTAHIPSPNGDGSTIRTDLIVNSGFYLNADSVFVERILGALEEGQTSSLFGIAMPEEGDVVAGDAVGVSATGAPTDTVHFAYRLAGLPEEAFTYLGAAASREAEASLAWDTLALPDEDYELVALYTEDEGDSVIYDVIGITVDNVGDGGGCAAVPVLPGGPLDPTLPALVGLLMVYLTIRRRRPEPQAALG